MLDGETRVPDADAALVEGGEPPSARVPLSRERILDAALAAIDEDGLAALTMRRLGARLGVEAMSLYRYVPGREQLLDGVVDLLTRSLDVDPDVLARPEHGWQDFLQRLAHGVRRIALAHPRAFPLVVSCPPEAPWLRPPLRSLTWVEAFLSALLDDGFDDESAAAAYRSFTSFLLGHLLLEVSQRVPDVVDEAASAALDGAEASAAAGWPSTTAGGGADGSAAPAGAEGLAPGHPVVSRLAPLLRQDHAAQEFEEALEGLLDRLALSSA